MSQDGSPFTAHTTNPVPFCVVGYDCKLREGGRLADIAPTMLKILMSPAQGNDRGVDYPGLIFRESPVNVKNSRKLSWSFLLFFQETPSAAAL